MTTKQSERIAQLVERREKAALGGGVKRIEAQHAKGKMTARERLAALLDAADVHPEIELILTGRNAPDFAVERAGLVSEVKCVKHYYTQGRPPKKGIEF